MALNFAILNNNYSVLIGDKEQLDNNYIPRIFSSYNINNNFSNSNMLISYIGNPIIGNYNITEFIKEYLANNNENNINPYIFKEEIKNIYSYTSEDLIDKEDFNDFIIISRDGNYNIVYENFFIENNHYFEGVQITAPEEPIIVAQGSPWEKIYLEGYYLRPDFTVDEAPQLCWELFASMYDLDVFQINRTLNNDLNVIIMDNKGISETKNWKV